MPPRVPSSTMLNASATGGNHGRNSSRNPKEKILFDDSSIEGGERTARRNTPSASPLLLQSSYGRHSSSFDHQISPDSPHGLTRSSGSNPQTPKRGNVGITFYNITKEHQHKKSQQQAASISTPKAETELPPGVRLEPMMQALFGVEFLPFDPRLTASASQDDDDDLSESEDDSSFYEDEDNGINESFTDTDGGNEKDGEKKKKKGPLRNLRRGLSTRKTKKKIRKMGRKSIVSKKGKDRQIFDNVEENIERQMSKIEKGKNKLVFLKSSLKSVQNETKRVMIETQRCSTRLSKVTRLVSELEYKMELALTTIEKENSNLATHTEAIARLDRARNQLESEAQIVEEMLQERLVDNNGGTPNNYNHSNVFTDEHGETIYNLDPDDDFFNRSPSDLSFTTADEPDSSLTESRSRAFSQDSSLISYDNEGIDLGIPPMPSTKPGCPPILTIKVDSPALNVPAEFSNYIRIQDLGLPPNAYCTSLSEHFLLSSDQVGSRQDLCSLDRDDYHVVLKALSARGVECATDDGPKWKPDKNTEKITSKHDSTVRNRHSTIGNNVLIWIGDLCTEGYGKKYPAVKARGVIDASPYDVAMALVDSSKVKIYNKMSLGRTDEYYFQKGIDCEGSTFSGEAKIVRNVTSVPLMRKKMELLNLLYARPLDKEIDGYTGYIIITRSIWEKENMAPSETSKGDSDEKSDFVRSEMLLGVNLICEIDDGSSKRSEFTTITHFHTPGIPSIGAKQFAMKAGGNYVRSIQQLFE